MHGFKVSHVWLSLLTLESKIPHSGIDQAPSMVMPVPLNHPWSCQLALHRSLHRSLAASILSQLRVSVSKTLADEVWKKHRNSVVRRTRFPNETHSNRIKLLPTHQGITVLLVTEISRSTETSVKSMRKLLYALFVLTINLFFRPS